MSRTTKKKTRSWVWATPMGAVVLAFPVSFGGESLGDLDECGITGEVELIEEWRYLPPETAASDRLMALAVWATRHPTAGIYVADAMSNSIVHLGLDGGFIRQIGRRGEGPGEFGTPIVVRARKNEFAVLDHSASINVFDTTGIVNRTVRLQPAPTSRRDFLVLNNGDFVVAGTVALSDHAIHVYGSDGHYLRGLGQIRMDLEEPILQMRYSDGYVAEAGAGKLAYVRRVPFEFMLFGQSELLHQRKHTDILYDYVAEVATPLESGGWKFSWRHPSLASFVPLPGSGGCFLATIARLPATVQGLLPEAEDFYSELIVLDDKGSVMERKDLSFYVRPTQAWRDPQGRLHVLAVSRDKTTGLHFPVQYLAVEGN